MDDTQTSGSGLFEGLNRLALGELLVKILVAVFVLALLIYASKTIAKMVSDRLRANSMGNDEYIKKVSGLVSDIIYYTLVVISVMIGLTIVGIDFGWILGGISFGIGFAFKDILGNLFAGIMVLTNKEFKLGDIIVIDDEIEYFGRVEEITIRYTVIRTFDLRKVIIPNLTLITKPVRTYDSEEIIRLDTLVSVHYDTNLHIASQVIVDAINALDFTRESESTRVDVAQFNESGIDLKVFFYFDPKGGTPRPLALSKVHHAIAETFREHKITIPYPHSTLTVDYNDKNLLGSMVYVAREAKKENRE